MINTLADLFSRKLIMVTGKGGVGKTTVSLALALLAVEQGKRVLLAEINAEGQISQLLGKKETGYPEAERLPGLWGVNITPRKSFEEYVLMQIKFKVLYKAIFENKFVRYFLDATPGLADLMCIGKVYATVDHYDLVIVDAPATGHGISLLQIASVVSRAVKIGPLKTHSDKIDQLLHDPNRTRMILVTLPEEMPTAETLEMAAWLKKNGIPLGLVILNQFRKSSLSGDESREFFSLPDKESQSSLKAMTLELARAELSSYHQDQLSRELKGVRRINLPFLYTTEFKLAEVQKIADSLEQELS